MIKKTYFKALKNQEESFRQYENICCMMFLNNTLIALSHIVFNIFLGLIYDQCHTLHAKPQVFFAFVLIIVNAIIFDQLRFLNSLNLVLKNIWFQVLVVNVLLKQLGDSEDINYFKVWLRFPCHSTCEKRRFDPHSIISIFVLEFLFVGVLYAKTWIRIKVWFMSWNLNLLN